MEERNTMAFDKTQIAEEYEDAVAKMDDGDVKDEAQQLLDQLQDDVQEADEAEERRSSGLETDEAWMLYLVQRQTDVVDAAAASGRLNDGMGIARQEVYGAQSTARFQKKMLVSAEKSARYISRGHNGSEVTETELQSKVRWISELIDRVGLQGRVINRMRNSFNELASQWSGTEHTPDGKEINFSQMHDGNATPIHTASMVALDALIGKEVKPARDKPQYNAAIPPKGEEPLMDSAQYVEALIADHAQRR